MVTKKHNLSINLSNGDKSVVSFEVEDGLSAFEIWVSEQPPKEDGTPYTYEDFLEFTKGSNIDKVEIISEVTTETVKELETIVKDVVNGMDISGGAEPFGIVERVYMEPNESGFCEIYIDEAFFKKIKLGKTAFIPPEGIPSKIYYKPNGIGRDSDGNKIFIKEWDVLDVSDGYSVVIDVLSKVIYNGNLTHGEEDEYGSHLYIDCQAMMTFGYDVMTYGFSEDVEITIRHRQDFFEFTTKVFHPLVNGGDFFKSTISPPLSTNISENSDLVYKKQDESVFDTYASVFNQVSDLPYDVERSSGYLKVKLNYTPFKISKVGEEIKITSSKEVNKTLQTSLFNEKSFLFSKIKGFVDLPHIYYDGFFNRVEYDGTNRLFSVKIVDKFGDTLTYSDIAERFIKDIEGTDKTEQVIYFPTAVLNGKVSPILGTVHPIVGKETNITI